MKKNLFERNGSMFSLPHLFTQMDIPMALLLLTFFIRLSVLLAVLQLLYTI